MARNFNQEDFEQYVLTVESALSMSFAIDIETELAAIRRFGLRMLLSSSINVQPNMFGHLRDIVDTVRRIAICCIPSTRRGSTSAIINHGFSAGDISQTRNAITREEMLNNFRALIWRFKNLSREIDALIVGKVKDLIKYRSNENDAEFLFPNIARIAVATNFVYKAFLEAKDRNEIEEVDDAFLERSELSLNSIGDDAARWKKRNEPSAFNGWTSPGWCEWSWRERVRQAEQGEAQAAQNEALTAQEEALAAQEKPRALADQIKTQWDSINVQQGNIMRKRLDNVWKIAENLAGQKCQDKESTKQFKEQFQEEYSACKSMLSVEVLDKYVKYFTSFGQCLSDEEKRIKRTVLHALGTSPDQWNYEVLRITVANIRVKPRISCRNKFHKVALDEFGRMGFDSGFAEVMPSPASALFKAAGAAFRAVRKAEQIAITEFAECLRKIDRHADSSTHVFARDAVQAESEIEWTRTSVARIGTLNMACVMHGTHFDAENVVEEVGLLPIVDIRRAKYIVMVLDKLIRLDDLVIVRCLEKVIARDIFGVRAWSTFSCAAKQLSNAEAAFFLSQKIRAFEKIADANPIETVLRLTTHIPEYDYAMIGKTVCCRCCKTMHKRQPEMTTFSCYTMNTLTRQWVEGITGEKMKDEHVDLVERCAKCRVAKVRDPVAQAEKRRECRLMSDRIRGRRQNQVTGRWENANSSKDTDDDGDDDGDDDDGDDEDDDDDEKGEEGVDSQTTQQEQTFAFLRHISEFSDKDAFVMLLSKFGCRMETPPPKRSRPRCEELIERFRQRRGSEPEQSGLNEELIERLRKRHRSEQEQGPNPLREYFTWDDRWNVKKFDQKYFAPAANYINEDLICGVCKRDFTQHQSITSIECDRCKKLYAPSCVGITAPTNSDFSKLDAWRCPACSR